jgi:hypothetical protein
MQLARAPYLAFLDADDLWLPEKLEKQVEVLEGETVDLVFCNKSYCDAEGREISRDSVSPIQGRASGAELFLKLYTGCFFVPSSVLARAELFRELGGFDEGLTACEDWDMWLRLAQAGCTFYGMPDKLLCYRVHPTSWSHNMDKLYQNDMVVLGRFSEHPSLTKAARRSPFRLRFRNHFTSLVDQGRFDVLPALLEQYENCDHDGYACRVMSLLKAVLPTKLFGLVSRYFVIPLAWHLERAGEASKAGAALLARKLGMWQNF